MRLLRIAMAQINTTVGDFDGNVKKILEAVDTARNLGADVVTLPELAVCGYPPEDLLFKPQFIKANLKSLQTIVEACYGITAIVGFVDSNEGIYNAAAVISDGKLIDSYHKIYLPNYGVFDEARYFKAGSDCTVYSINDIAIGVSICEDIWYEKGPAAMQAYAGAEVIINISASPYHAGKGKAREEMIAKRASDYRAIVAYNNLVGGQDELVFDGHSVIFDENGNPVARGKQFEEEIIVADLDIDSVAQNRLRNQDWLERLREVEATNWKHTVKTVPTAASVKPKPGLAPPNFTLLDPQAEIYKALVTGTRDYIHKNGFKGVVIGLSGGIDSALVAAVAVDAIGKENVTGVSMSSRFSSTGSVTDTETLAKNLGIKLLSIPIEEVMLSYLGALSESFAERQPDITEENIQARIRGNLLMALSNKFGWLVLTTGNKSEMATGYTTLYGDMAGGFAVIKDVPKTLVYKVAKCRNEQAGFDLIPEAILDKPPSAELRFDQKDSDSLPPYEVLDPILTAYVEEDKSVDRIIGMGFDKELVRQTAKLVDRSEYKRRQSPPGVKITARAFGRDRRLPITNRFKEW